MPSLKGSAQLYAIIYQFICNKTLNRLDWPDLQAAIAHEIVFIQSAGSGCAATLPIWTCIAVDGAAETAVPLAAAWFLYNLASDIFDDLQDQDGKERLWNTWETAQAMNVGLGLIAIANQYLARLSTTPNAHCDILDAWARTFTLAAQGQNNVAKRPSLEDYFRQTITKSGFIYATIARAGARLVTSNSALLNAMYDYGYALGMVIQIVDDCRDISPALVASDLANGTFTLPAIYALSQKEAERYPELLTLFASSSALAPSEIEKALALIVETNALSRSLAFAKFYEQKALAALKSLPSKRAVAHLTNHVTYFLANARHKT